jgi:multidrug efflux pump subunit AcrA (membrane-fusion protein)
MWVRLADCETDKHGNYTCTPTTSEAMETATRNVELANAKVAQARARIEELRNPDAPSVDAGQANLAKAKAQYDAAVARHEARLLGASDADIASAEADLASAKASLANLLAGPTATDLKIYQIRVAQAEIDLQEARNALADAILVAPFDGVVTDVPVKEGERASGVAVELVDTQRLEVVLNVDEVDLNRIEVGQSAIVTLESWPDVEIEGHIAAIAPSATDNSSGIVSYEVHVRLEASTEIPIRVGMTANADLITTRRRDVLLVPNAAITADRQAGVYRVNLVRTTPEGDQATTPVEVTIGARDDEYTQITSGLSEGDEVLLGTLSAPSEPEFGPPGGAGGGFSG